MPGAADLLHGKETRVWGDQAYRGQRAAIRAAGAAGEGLHQPTLSLGRAHRESIKANNRTKSRVRAKVEHVFGVIKRVFGFQKVRYRGLAKNLHRLEVTAALANLFMVRRHLLRSQGA